MSKSRRRRHTRHYHGDARDPHVQKASQRLSPGRCPNAIGGVPCRLRNSHAGAHDYTRQSGRPMEVESRHPTQESAIAAALEASQPGDVVEIHAPDCPVSAIADPTVEDLEQCGCETLVAQVGGARA